MQLSASIPYIFQLGGHFLPVPVHLHHFGKSQNLAHRRVEFVTDHPQKLCLGLACMDKPFICQHKFSVFSLYLLSLLFHQLKTPVLEFPLQGKKVDVFLSPLDGMDQMMRVQGLRQKIQHPDLERFDGFINPGMTGDHEQGQVPLTLVTAFQYSAEL